MINRRQFVMGSSAWGLAGCALRHERVLDVAYINLRAWTADSRKSSTDAIGIVGNKIAVLGRSAVESHTGKRTQIIDLEGAFVTPGFIDNHTHFLTGSNRLTQPDLLSATSRQEFADRLGKAARERPGKWILGGSWDEQRLGGDIPDKSWIDAATPDTPVAVPRTDLHMYLLNSVALKMAGITRDTPDIDGGVIGRDANGDPNGILKDNARSLARRAFPETSHAEQNDNMRGGIAHALSRGFTQVHSVERGWSNFETARRLREKGDTDLRFYCFAAAKNWQKLSAIIKAEGRGDEWVRWGGVKALSDGSLGSRTALFRDPYSDEPGHYGVRTIQTSVLKDYILGADKANLQVATHAIGDLANDEVLDIYKDVARINGPRDRRFRIEHAQHLTLDAIGRFARQNVIASVQPYHAIDDGRWADKRIGQKRLQGTYAFHSLMEKSAVVTFGSDWPVAPLNLFQGLYAAVTRQTIDGENPNGWIPHEKVAMEQALTAYTVNNAYSGFQEKKLGQIRTGFLADLTVFDRNLLNVKPDEILTTQVLKTIVNGRERYRA
ncbi:amidohydrolase [Robiginitomaculum antarcticum]|uniref:amidohydrolase n=1 Tax=Robiginitomaculum antarcticum TaxID=437507 RepID=UPI00039CEBFB|nr:amidohydrolase [Robiginitomaculum antarcticum]